MQLIPQAKKDVSQIFNNLLRRQIGTRWPTVEYLTSKPEVLFTALKGLVSCRRRNSVGYFSCSHLFFFFFFNLQLWEPRRGVEHWDDTSGDAASWSSCKDTTLFRSLLHLSRPHWKDDVWRFMWRLCQFQRDSHEAQGHGSWIPGKELRQGKSVEMVEEKKGRWKLTLLSLYAAVLYHVQRSSAVTKLCHKATVPQAARRDTFRSNKLQRHD